MADSRVEAEPRQDEERMENDAVDSREAVKGGHGVTHDVEQSKGGEEHGEGVGHTVRQGAHWQEVDEVGIYSEDAQRRDDLDEVVLVFTNELELDPDLSQGETSGVDRGRDARRV